MSLREYSTFCKSGNNSIRVYCDSLRNLSTMAEDIANSMPTASHGLLKRKSFGVHIYRIIFYVKHGSKMRF